MNFSYTITNVPGEYLNTADTLSRKPVQPASTEDALFEEEVEIYALGVLHSLPASDERLQQIGRV